MSPAISMRLILVTVFSLNSVSIPYAENVFWIFIPESNTASHFLTSHISATTLWLQPCRAAAGRSPHTTQITVQHRELGRLFFPPTPPNKWILEANTEWIDFQLILDNLSILKILPTDKSNKQLSTLRKQFLFTFDISGQRYNTVKCTQH